MFEQTESQKTIVANELKHLSDSELLDVLECVAEKTSSWRTNLITRF